MKRETTNIRAIKIALWQLVRDTCVCDHLTTILRTCVCVWFGIRVCGLVQLVGNLASHLDAQGSILGYAALFTCVGAFFPCLWARFPRVGYLPHVRALFSPCVWVLSLVPAHLAWGTRKKKNQLFWILKIFIEENSMKGHGLPERTWIARSRSGTHMDTSNA